MGDVREVFPVLADVSGTGVPLSQAQVGYSPTGLNGLVALGFRDSSGNLVLPQLDSLGRLATTSEAVGINKRNHGSNAGSKTEVAIATITLTATKKYANVAFQVSCTRTTVFRLVWNNNAVETEVEACIVGPGHFSFQCDLPNLTVTAGGTGTQELKVYGMNLDTASTMRATVSAVES